MLILGLGTELKHPDPYPAQAGMGWEHWAAVSAGVLEGKLLPAARSVPSCNPTLPPSSLPHEQMEKALANLALRTAEAGAGEPMVSKAPAPASTSSALKGVSQDLLERVSNSVLALTPGLGGPCPCLT